MKTKMQNTTRSKTRSTIKKEYLRSLVGNTIFGITFIKKDKTIRDMKCRFGVKKNLNPNSRGLSEKQKEAYKNSPYLTVTDIDQDKYKRINVDTILSIRARGIKIERKNTTDNFTVRK